MYDVEAKCPRWDQFVNEIFDGNRGLVAYIQRLCGHTLTGTTEEQILIMLWGAGQNGKSTLVNILSHIFGDYGSEMAVETIIEKKFDNKDQEADDWREYQCALSTLDGND